MDSLLACVKEAYLLAPSSPHVLTQVWLYKEGGCVIMFVTSWVRYWKAVDATLRPVLITVKQLPRILHSH